MLQKRSSRASRGDYPGVAVAQSVSSESESEQLMEQAMSVEEATGLSSKDMQDAIDEHCRKHMEEQAKKIKELEKKSSVRRTSLGRGKGRGRVLEVFCGKAEKRCGPLQLLY